MRRCPPILTALLAGLASAGVVAGSVDPLESAECNRALQQLQAQEATVAAQVASAPVAGLRADGRARAPDARLQTLRRRAAQICLGRGADAAPASRAQAPVSVPPITATPPEQMHLQAPAPSPQPTQPVLPAQVPVPARPALPAPPPVQAPTVITSCDPTGCWASDGSRLQRMGQNLLGPRGLCTAQGTLLQCP